MRMNKCILQSKKCVFILAWFKPGFLNQWATGDFAVDHRAIRKIGCLVKKSVISVIYICWNRGLRCADFFFGDQGKNRSPRGEDFFFFFWDQGNHWANNTDSKVETFFSRRRGTEQWAMQTFKKHKMGPGSEKVENHWYKPTAFSTVYKNLLPRFKVILSMEKKIVDETKFCQIIRGKEAKLEDWWKFSKKTRMKPSYIYPLSNDFIRSNARRIDR